jgi:adenylate cyclase
MAKPMSYRPSKLNWSPARSQCLSKEGRMPIDFEPVYENERRFIVRDITIVSGAPWEKITQAYLFALDDFAVRVRLVQHPQADGSFMDAKASLTGKGPRVDASREEYDVEVSTGWAKQVISRSANVVTKRRYQLVTDETWEIDEFLGENTGLWIAELEGAESIHRVTKPDWAAHEVRNDPRFNNENLAVKPFASWTSEDQAQFKRP